MTASQPPTLAPPPARNDLITRATVAWVAFAHRRPWMVLAITVLLMALSGWVAATRLGMSTDTSAMLSPDLPFQRDQARFSHAFPDLGGGLVVVIDGQTPELADRGAHALIEGLALRRDVILDAVDIAGLPFFRQNGLLYLPLDQLDKLSTTLVRAQPFIAGLWADPSLRGLAAMMDLALGQGADALSKQKPGEGFALAPILDAMAEVTAATAQGTSAHMAWSSVLGAPAVTGTPGRRFVLVKPLLDHSSLAPAAGAMNAIRAVAESRDLRPAAGITLRITGPAALDQEELASVSTGMDRAGLVTTVLVAIILAIGLGSGRLIFATLTTMVAGLLMTIGFAAATVGTLNLISVAFAVLFIGLSVDFGIHFGLRYREGRDRGLENGLALEGAARGAGRSQFLVALAAAFAFFAFLPTDYLGLAQLGLISGVGMFIALLINQSTLASLMTLMPAKPRGNWLSESRPTSGLAQVPRRHPRVVLGLFVVLAIGALVLLPRARFDFDPLNLKDPRTESVATLLDIMGDPGLDPYSINVLAANASQAAVLTEALKALPEVRGVASLPALVPADQDAKLAVIDDLAFVLGPSLSVEPREPPSAPDLAAARDRLARRLAQTSQGSGPLATAAGRLAAALSSLPNDTALLRALDDRLLDGLTHQLALFRDGLNAQPVSADDIPPELRRRYMAADGRARLEVFPRATARDYATLARFVEAVRTVAPDATGSPVLIIEAGRTVMGAFVEAAAIAAVLIALMLAISLRSGRAVVLIFAPVILAGVLTIGASVLAGQAFNFANVIVLPLLVGLGVSGGIYVVERTREERNSGTALASSTPRAVMFSAFTTIASFGSIALSSHPGTASMGILLTIALGLSLLCTLAFLPALVALWPERRRKPSL
ncbi:hypothetical protein CKO38_11380 [Rhodospirillum rubrum]|uniref:MMPL family transporter n=1 Tax=Rhodospirillum rubrum TaxID=1085 RepID=UPI0019068719|nr:MMPL family transporter [Rhodospirillum rubrum]MBK1665426.1 hypothetical protein [Rhodospirillum rubrum]MBK1677255.1 hypothetical protein [Rhodospirillum rubrum]